MPAGLPSLTGGRGKRGHAAMNALTEGRSPTPSIPLGPKNICGDVKTEGMRTNSGTIVKPQPKEYKNGGKVKITGNAKLHKNEVVLPVNLVKEIREIDEKIDLKGNTN